MRGSPCCSAARVLAARLREGHSQNQSWLASTRWKRCKAGSESEQFHQESGKTGFCQWQHIFPGCWPGLRGRISVWLGLQLLMLSFMGSKPNYTNPYRDDNNRIGLAAILLRKCSKVTKHDAAICVGAAAKLRRKWYKERKLVSCSSPFNLEEILSSFASKPL